ncbi:MnhB domain-containing protein [Nocardia rhizosphaerihabitans]|uniref:HTH cro/C1-type domain-containing protein n=1 Tax=Nocardia rhizosphaerihabitans TaxID=1691570 RepID=A0ABQ2K7C4_9NOCA|nr:MnhB domain-containing protein [Nocardia rhizosphaerihabitans]GGN65911.1 hypothetical protein GCM10011610_00240 [Nocardia rhizosphaerihabitans]
MTIPVNPRHNKAEDPNDTAAAAYMAMLRRIHEVSGFTAGQIAIYSGLPRSTAYRFIDPNNNTLPKNRNQVEAFLHACRVPQRNVDRMLELWDEVSGNPIRQNASAGRVLPPAEDDDTALPIRKKSSARRVLPPAEDDDTALPKSTPEPVWEEWDDEQYPLTEVPRQRGAAALSAAHSQPPREEDLTVQTTMWTTAHAHGDPCICMDLAHRPPAPNQSPPAATGSGLGMLAVRVVPLVMLLMALYPLAVAVWFGHRFTGGLTGIISVIVAVVLLMMITAWTHRSSEPSGLTPTRLALAAFGGLCAGVLAWAAVPVLPIATLTGFVVFTMAPMWFSLTKLADIATSTHGVFALIAALWCGITLGTAAAHTGFPVFGSILVGVLGSATAVAMLCANSPGADRPRQKQLEAVRSILQAADEARHRAGPPTI